MAPPRQQLLALLVSAAACAAVAAAQPTASPAAVADNSSDSTPAGVGIKVSFRPRVAIVVGIFTMIFSLTFILLMYAKFCHPASSPASPPLQVGAGGNDDGAATAAACVGVPKQAIESLPLFRFSALRGARQGMECSVCLARFDDADLLRLLPRCRHAFHLGCVDRWLLSSATCPLCRATVDAHDAAKSLSSSARIVFGGGDDAAAAGTDTDTGSGRRDLLDIFVERERVPPPGPGPGPAPELELDRHKHRIVVFKSRWSELNSADLVALDTEMLRSMSSGRFVFPPDSPYNYCPDYSNEAQAPAAADEQVDGIVPTTTPSRHRLLEPVVVVDARLGGGGGCGGGSAVSASAARVISSGVRSVSEIVSLPRLRAAARERLSEEENRRWLPIARRTARWFASRGQQQEEEEEEHRAVHVVAAEHDDV